MSTPSHGGQSASPLLPENAAPVPTWKKVLAAVLDFLTVFFAGGFLIGTLTQSTTSDGFQLEGLPALVLFALIAVYFVVGSKYLGGTIWQRILRTRS
jgi:DMSO reductase anchor subunit